jgi:hypothetical protein
MGYLRENAITLLGSVSGVDLNATGETTLYTCPTGKSCIITHIVMRSPSAGVTTASLSFGWNTGDADDVVANAVVSLTGTGNYEVIDAKSDATVGAAGGTFKIDVNTAEGGALTATFDVFGYLF